MNLFSNLDWKPPIEKDTSRLPDLVCQRCFRLLGIHESLETLNFKEEDLEHAWSDFYDLKVSKTDTLNHSTGVPIENSNVKALVKSGSLSSSLPNDSRFLSKASFSSSFGENSTLMKSMGDPVDDNVLTDEELLITDFYLTPHPDEYGVEDLSTHVSNTIRQRNDLSKRFLRDVAPVPMDILPETIQRKSLVEKLTPPAFLPTYSKPRKPENKFLRLHASNTIPQIETKLTREEHIAFRHLLDRTMDTYDIDLPVCYECSFDLHEQIVCDIENVDDDIEKYEKALAKIEKEEIQQHLIHMDEVLRRTRVSYNHYHKELEETLEARRWLCYNIEKLIEGEKTLSKIDKRFWKKFGNWKIASNQYNEEIGSTQNELDKSQEKLYIMRNTNVWNDVFHIWADGHFGTVNDLRLGIRCFGNVFESSTNEVSSALGLVALLISFMAEKLNAPNGCIKFLGSLSSIEDETGEEYPLHMENINKSFMTSSEVKKFDRGILTLVKYIKRLSDIVVSLDPNYHLPIPMTENGDVGSYLPRRKKNTEEDWTHAMKQFLINVKHLFDWVIKRDLNNRLVENVH